MVRFGKVATVSILLLCVSMGALAQKPIKGIIIDSLTFAPLLGVNLSLKNTSRGTTTDIRGEFRILAKPSDTLVFSLVGYKTEIFSAMELEETTLIRLAEEVRILQVVDVISRKEEKKPKGLTLRPKGALMNYGPSGAGVNFAYFTKQEREKRKLNKVVAVQEMQRNYVAVVTSPEVREKIIYDFHLSEDEYYQILAGFNLDNGNSLYELTQDELLLVLTDYVRQYAHRDRR